MGFIKMTNGKTIVNVAKSHMRTYKVMGFVEVDNTAVAEAYPLTYGFDTTDIPFVPTIEEVTSQMVNHDIIPYANDINSIEGVNIPVIPISQWTKSQLISYAEKNAISYNGITVKELREVITKHSEQEW